MKKQVAAILDMIRPALQADGGDVELIDVGKRGCKGTPSGGLCRMSHVTDDP